MAKIENYVCDSCGKVLYGKKGLAFIRERYLQIKGGKMLIQDFDKDAHASKFAYITPNIPEFELSFCDPMTQPCFMDYLKYREESWFRQREANLRAETSEFIVGNDKWRKRDHYSLEAIANRK